VCFDTGSPAKVTSTVDGRNNAIGEALRQAQDDWKKEDGRDESRPYVESSRRAATQGRPYGFGKGVSRYAPASDEEPLTLPSPTRGEGLPHTPFGSAFFSTLGNSIFA